MEIQKKGVRIVKTICGCCWVMQFFFLRKRTKDLLRSMFQWDMKNKEKSDVITYVENPTTILYHHRKKGRSIELFIKYHVVYVLWYTWGTKGLRAVNEGWNKADHKYMAAQVLCFDSSHTKKSLRWKLKRGKKPTLISDHYKQWQS